LNVCSCRATERILSPDFPLGVELEVFVRRVDAERFVEEVRGDEPELAATLRVEESERRYRGRAATASRGGRGRSRRR